MPKPATDAKPKGSGRPERGDFAAIVAAGDRRAALEALRDELAAAMEDAAPSVKAQLSQQLRGTLKELAELPDGRKVSKADELADRRRARLAAAQAATPTGTEVQ